MTKGANQTYPVVTSDYTESIHYGILRHGSANVHKIGWFTPVQFDGIHCGHRKAGTIHSNLHIIVGGAVA